MTAQLEELATGIGESAFIGGADVRSRSEATYAIHNPSTGTQLAAVPSCDSSDVDQAVDAAEQALVGWRASSLNQRAEILRKVSALIERDAETLAQVEAINVGKPLSQARSDVRMAKNYFQFYAGAVDKSYGSTIPFDHNSLGLTIREPIGVTGHITPWNYPLAIAARSLAPALAAANTCVLKPADETPLSALMLARLAAEAGLPEGCLNVVTGTGVGAGAPLASHSKVRHVAFTGSPATGTAVMIAAAANWTPVTLELGGKSPNVVFGDADLDKAIPALSRSLLQNSGQTCSAGTRLLVHQDIRDEVVGRVADTFGKVQLGAAIDDPDMGPVVSMRQLDRMVGMVGQAVEEGAQVVTGGERDLAPGTADGFFMQPTLLDSVGRDSTAVREEIFGPVLVVQPFADEDEAAFLANDTDYGLAGAVWTSDYHRAMRFVRDMRCGQVYVNTYALADDVVLPFGGYKKSGFGREKGFQAIETYTQLKAAALKFD